jgi:chromosome partitioning protein
VSRIIAVANQKGGVAKTTTVHAVAAGLVERGCSVMAIDLDPQASLSFAMGVETEPDPSMHHVMMGKASLDEILYESDGIDLAPSSIDLAGAEMSLLTRTGREYVLERALRPVEGYDYILIDCPPSLGILTINALTAAGEVLVPVQAETLSRRGVSQLLETVGDVRQFTNPRLMVTGALVTMFDSRTRHGREQLEQINAIDGLTVLEPPIPKSVRVAEAPGRGRSVLGHARSHPAAAAYRLIVEAIDA